MEIGFRSIFIIALIICSGIAAGNAFWRLFRLMKLAQPEALVWDLPKRLWIFTKNVVFQAKLFKKPWRGLFHGFIMIGFVVVTTGSAEHILEGLFTGFSFDFLPFYPALALLQDIFKVLVLVAVAFFLARRLLLKNTTLSDVPKHRRDGLIVLTFTGAHIGADLFSFAFWAASGNPHGQAAIRPISAGLGQLIAQTGLSAPMLDQVAWVLWGIHIATVFGFLAYIPYSKHLHVFAAGPNFFLARLRPRGRI